MEKTDAIPTDEMKEKLSHCLNKDTTHICV